jgi:hypothetical protein
MLERGKRMLDRRHRIAGRLDDDVDLGMRDERAPVVAEVRAVILERSVDRRRGEYGGLPADALEVRLRIRGREVSDADEMGARRLRHLREVHRGELARADQAQAQRILFALLQLCVEIHKPLKNRDRQRFSFELREIVVCP